MVASATSQGPINVAIAGVGNCASSLIEGIAYYRQHPDSDLGLLFPTLSGYSVRDISVVAAFDISADKVGVQVDRAMYQAPNNFVRNNGVRVTCPATVFRAPTLDGNPEHLARFVRESSAAVVDVPSVLRDNGVHILVNLLPTGSHQAAMFYARAAVQAGCAFINCIPTPIAQIEEFQQLFAKHRLPLLGDDIKSQLGTTILHRTLLNLFQARGASLTKSTQINIGGNTDFANFVHRGESKLVSKRKSLQSLVGEAQSHVGHHYDPTRGPLKHALIQLEGQVFGGSTVKIDVTLQSDDKPNSAGTLIDLLRLAKGALDGGTAGYLPEACAFYMKSPPIEMADLDALELIKRKWSS